MRAGKTFFDKASETMTTVAPTEGMAHVSVTDRKSRLALFSVLSADQARDAAEELHHIADELDAEAAAVKADAEAKAAAEATAHAHEHPPQG